MVGSRLEYDTMKTKGDRNEMSVEIKTSATEGIIFFAQQSGGTDTMAVYLQEGKVITNTYIRSVNPNNNNTILYLF